MRKIINKKTNIRKNNNKSQRTKKIRLLTQSNVKVLPQLEKTAKLKKAGDSISLSNKGMLFDNLIDVETTAEVLGVAPKTIRKWVSIRFIPYLKLGRRVLFRPKSLELWLNRKENKSWL